jgi:cytochrome c553
MAQHFATLELPYPAPQPSNLPPRLTSVAEGLVRRGDPGREIPACAQCHGEQLLGVAPDMPGLLGLSRYYLYAQLNQWKNGTRRAQVPDCMATIASRLTPEEVSALAAWLAAQPVAANGKPADGFVGPLPMRCGSIANKGAG